MAETDLERRRFYLVPEKDGNQVVQLRELEETTLVVADPLSGETWTIRRAPFESRLDDGRIVEVTPRWEPAGEAVEV